jgi:secreted trypsin-like serine protease
MPIETQISYVQNPDGACNGDSGGPAFVDPADDGIDGQWYVGGVTSYGDGTCALYGSSTRVPAFEDWIDSVLNPACKATGTACGSGSECCSGSCLGKGKQKTCG